MEQYSYIILGAKMKWDPGTYTIINSVIVVVTKIL